MIGRKSINGARYHREISGEIVFSKTLTIYEAVRSIVEHMEASNRDMELPDCVQITINPENQDPIS